VGVWWGGGGALVSCAHMSLRIVFVLSRGRMQGLASPTQPKMAPTHSFAMESAKARQESKDKLDGTEAGSAGQGDTWGTNNTGTRLDTLSTQDLAELGDMKLPGQRGGAGGAGAGTRASGGGMSSGAPTPLQHVSASRNPFATNLPGGTKQKPPSVRGMKTSVSWTTSNRESKAEPGLQTPNRHAEPHATNESPSLQVIPDGRQQTTVCAIL